MPPLLRRFLFVVGIFSFFLRLGIIIEALCQDDDIVSLVTPVYNKEHNQELGLVKYFYHSSRANCRRILLLGVGTSMTVENGYNRIATATVRRNPSLIVMILDHHVHSIVKTSATRYAALSNQISLDFPLLLPDICGEEYTTSSSSDDDKHRQVEFLIGGHSSSGEAAMLAALQEMFQFQPIGFVGLDPFEISNRTMGYNFNSFVGDHAYLTMPALSFGFLATTCWVKVEKAALAQYQRSNHSSRVLYLIDNQRNGMTHCVFTDSGCGTWPLILCGGGDHDNPFQESVYEAFAESIQKFLHSISSGLFVKKDFELSTSIGTNVKLCVTNDECSGADFHPIPSTRGKESVVSSS